MSERVASSGISNEDFAGILEVVADHNQSCAVGLEVTLQLVCMEGEEYVKKNCSSFERSEFLAVVGGYATSGVLLQLKDI